MITFSLGLQAEKVKIFNHGGEKYTTGPLRYPQLMISLQQLPQESVRRILLLGPGKVAGLNGPVVPQVHEIQALFPEAEITVIDLPESQIQEVMEKSTYDSSVKEMSNSLFNFNSNFKNSKEQAEYRKKLSEVIQRVPEAIDMRQIQVEYGDFFYNLVKKPQLQKYNFVLKIPHYDVIIATKSLAYSFVDLVNNGQESLVQDLFIEIIKLLADGGSLFIDLETLEIAIRFTSTPFYEKLETEKLFKFYEKLRLMAGESKRKIQSSPEEGTIVYSGAQLHYQILFAPTENEKEREGSYSPTILQSGNLKQYRITTAHIISLRKPPTRD